MRLKGFNFVRVAKRASVRRFLSEHVCSSYHFLSNNILLEILSAAAITKSAFKFLMFLIVIMDLSGIKLCLFQYKQIYLLKTFDTKELLYLFDQIYIFVITRQA